MQEHSSSTALPVVQFFTASRFYLVLFLLAIYLTVKISSSFLSTYRARYRYTDIPGLPRHPIWGNLVNVGEKLNPALRRHTDYAFEEVWESLGRPPAFLLDMYPIDKAFLIVGDPSIAEQVAQSSGAFKMSLPKSETFHALSPLIGLESLILAEGDEAKRLRKRFTRGFSSAHLHTLDALIISKTRIFVDRLKAAAESGAVFSLKDYSQDLTTDIITTVAIEKDFHAQTTPDGQGHKGPLGMLTASRILSKLVFPTGRGFNPLVLLDPVRPAKSWFYEKIFDRELSKVIKQQITAEQKQSQTIDGKDPNAAVTADKALEKSIIRLALSGLEPDAALIRNTVAQVKSFLFAGQDTTATLIQWLCFELSKASWSPASAAVLQRLGEEHDSVFGKEGGPFNALDTLSRTDEEGRRETEAILGSRLPYTTAFIKETLRLHPPAATARRVPELSPQNPTPVTFRMRAADGQDKDIQVNGLRVYPSQYLIHRNPAVWGPDAHEFRPERWLDEAYMAQLPAGAWRAFERGPRNCIGQELAMVEARVVLCAVARAFEWCKVGFSGRSGAHEHAVPDRPSGDGSDHPDREVWSVNQVTSVPVDGMVMKVKLRVM